MATRKVISKKSEPMKKVEEAPVVVEPVAVVVATPAEESERPSKKVCSFCQKKTSPTYTDLATLKRYMTERAKIVARDRSGVCSKHQRAVAKNIKYARHLSLLPFVPQV